MKVYNKKVWFRKETVMQILENLFTYYTRLESDRSALWLRRPQDWFVFFLFALAFWLYIKSHQNTTNKKSFLFSSHALLLFHIFFRYIIHIDYYPWYQRLPFYSCSIVAIILPCLFFGRQKSVSFQNTKLYNWASFAGIYGGFLAIFFSEPSEFQGFHLVNTDYYLGHFLIVAIGLSYILDRPKPFTEEELKSTSEFTLLYLLLCLIINPILGTNYGFISQAPLGLKFLQAIPTPFVSVLVIAAHLLANFLVWHGANIFLNKKLHLHASNTEKI